MQTKFNIGDKVWHVKCGTHRVYVTCPDCNGTGQLTVIMGDGSQVSITCSCSEYAGIHEGVIRGKVSHYEWDADVESGVISGIDIDTTRVREPVVEYRISISSCSAYIVNDTTAFSTKEEAFEYAKKLAEEHNNQEREEVYKKEKPNHTWAWNATYHRRQIASLKKQLEHHESKLNVAKVKAKENEN